MGKRYINVIMVIKTRKPRKFGPSRGREHNRESCALIGSRSPARTRGVFVECFGALPGHVMLIDVYSRAR